MSKPGIFETIKFDAGEYGLLGLHLKRFAAAANFYGYGIDDLAVQDALARAAEQLQTGKAYRVRLLLDKSGIRVEASEYDKRKEPLSVRLRLVPHNVLSKAFSAEEWHYKSNRTVDMQGLKTAEEAGLFDFINVDADGYVLDGCRSNVYIQAGDELFTPPLKVGVLAGVYREFLIKQGKARERNITRDELFAADKVFLSNSLIGLALAELGK